MRLNSFIIICVLLALAVRAEADNITVDDVNIKAGQTRQVAIVLNNPERQYAAFQIDLALPDGIGIAKNDKGKYVASLNGNRIDDHTLNISKKTGNTYRFMSFSMSNAEFSGTTGALIYFTIEADANFSSTKEATFTSVVLTEADGTQHTLGNTSFTIGETVPNKCAAPTITYNKGRLNFYCSTPGARFVSSLTTTDVKNESEGSGIDLSACYVVNVYAVAEGYADSDPVTATITWGDGTMKVENISVESTLDVKGDVNGDNNVNVADIATIIDEMAARAREQKEIDE